MPLYPGLGIEYDPQRIYLDVKRVESKTPNYPAVRWLEMGNDFFQGLGAMVVDVEVRRGLYPFLYKIDHLNFCPLREDVNPNLNYPLSHYGDDEYDRVDRGRVFVDRLKWVINGNSKVGEQVVEILEQGKKIGKIPLTIEAHGVEIGGVRFLGPEKTSAILPLEVVLCNLVKVLRAAKYSVGSVMSSIESRYSMVAVYACNATNVDISQETVDYMGVPVLYSYEILGGIRNKARSVIVLPRQQV